MATIFSGSIIECTAEDKKIKYLSSKNCLFFVLSGKGLCGKHRIQRGAGFYVNRNAYVDYSSSEESPLRLAYFTLEGISDDHPLIQKGTESAVAFTVIDEEYALDIITALLPEKEYRSIGEQFDDAAADLLLSFVTLSKRVSVKPRSGKQHVDAAVKFINDNFHRDIRVESIAEELMIDRKYLRNLFTKYMGMSTMEYIMKTRMDRAKALLGDKESSISLVASSVGYRDVLAFSKAFKRAVGVSPSEYREGSVQKAAEAEKAQTKRKRDVPVFIL